MRRGYEYTIMLRYTLTLFLLLAPAVDAALYKWVDEEGVTHFTKTLPPEAAVRGSEVITEQGRVLKKTHGERTAEEKAEAERLESEKERKKKAKKAVEKRDRALLNSYRAEEDIIIKRDEKLAYLDDRISSLKKKYETTNKEHERLIARVVRTERGGNLPSETDKGNIRSSRRELEDHKLQLDKISQERESISQAFAEEAKRFRELKGL